MCITINPDLHSSLTIQSPNMSRHTIITTVANRPGAMSRTMQQLDHVGVPFSAMAIGVVHADDARQLTLAVSAEHARQTMQVLGTCPDVMHVIDASAAMRSANVMPARCGMEDFRAQADGH